MAKLLTPLQFEQGRGDFNAPRPLKTGDKLSYQTEILIGDRADDDSIPAAPQTLNAQSGKSSGLLTAPPTLSYNVFDELLWDPEESGLKSVDLGRVGYGVVVNVFFYAGGNVICSNEAMTEDYLTMSSSGGFRLGIPGPVIWFYRSLFAAPLSLRVIGVY